jgi:predicted ribosomally synthesized peptide with nif11-like leader
MQTSLNQFFTALSQDGNFKQRLKAAKQPEIFLQVMQEYGYSFTKDDLQRIVQELPEEELAAVLNPGVAPRRHLIPM